MNKIHELGHAEKLPPEIELEMLNAKLNAFVKTHTNCIESLKTADFNPNIMANITVAYFFVGVLGFELLYGVFIWQFALFMTLFPFSTMICYSLFKIWIWAFRCSFYSRKVKKCVNKISELQKCQETEPSHS
jgi:ABC-type transport system involved in Fe-S cluster assembly fused permease/ATPase subunit